MGNQTIMSIEAFKGYCEHMVGKTIVECGTFEDDFFLTFDDKTTMFMMAEQDYLSLSLYVPKEIKQ